MRSSLALAGTAALASAIKLDVPGYKRTDLGYKAINAPIVEDCYTYMQHSLYSDVTDAAKLDPARCIRDCEETTAFNAQHLGGRASCRFVNTYILLKDGYSQGQVCSMYTATWDASFATNKGYTDYKTGAEYTICDSYTYSNYTDPGVPGKDCIGPLPYKPQPPVDPTSTQIPVYPTSTVIPTYPTSTFTTVTTTSKSVEIPTTTTSKSIEIPTTTTSKSIEIPTTTSVVIPTTTSVAIPTTTSVVIPTTTSVAIPTTTSVVIPTTTSAPVVLPTSSAAPVPPTGPQFRCTGLLSSPQCCQTDVLDLASLTCEPPRRDFTTRADFRAACAETGSTANCCLLPILGQGLVCQDV